MIFNGFRIVYQIFILNLRNIGEMVRDKMNPNDYGEID